MLTPGVEPGKIALADFKSTVFTISPSEHLWCALRRTQLLRRGAKRVESKENKCRAKKHVKFFVL